MLWRLLNEWSPRDIVYTGYYDLLGQCDSKIKVDTYIEQWNFNIHFEKKMILITDNKNGKGIYLPVIGMKQDQNLVSNPIKSETES